MTSSTPRSLSDAGPLLRVVDLTVEIPQGGRSLWPVRRVSFEVARGETLAIVGESGSGKTLSCLALVRLLPPPARVAGGEIVFDRRDVRAMGSRELGRVRGRRIGLVLQDPTAALDPVFPVGDQIAEVIMRHRGVGRGTARREAIRRMEELEIPGAAGRFGDHPHQFSGGMKQRIAVAIALAGDPDLIIADEPTTALDVTTEHALLELLARIRHERRLAMILVTHDLAVAAEVADRMCVLYAGRVVEIGPTAALLGRPGHPYTEALTACAVSLEAGRGGRLATIKGTVPRPDQDPDQCSFAERCPYTIEMCRRSRPPLIASDGTLAACFRTDRERNAAW